MPHQHVAIFDWGIGGLSVLAPMIQSCPQNSFLYFSDSGFTPYGKLSSQNMKQRLEKLFSHATTQFKIEMLIIACNAASTAFIGEKTFKDTPLYNVIEPTAKYMNHSRYNKIGIIGGNLTASTNTYGKLIQQKETLTVPTQILSALIESGNTSSLETQKILEEQLLPLKQWKPDALILGCTHYPALSQMISKTLPDVDLIDPAKILINSLNKDDSQRSKDQTSLFFTTGQPQEMKSSASKAFGFHIEKVTHFST